MFSAYRSNSKYQWFELKILSKESIWKVSDYWLFENLIEMRHLNNKFEKDKAKEIAWKTEPDQIVTEFIVCRKTNSYGSRVIQNSAK